MRDTLISFDTPELREKTIAHMVEQMRKDIASADAGSVEARTSAMLIAVMPMYLRMLDKERKTFALAIHVAEDPVSDMLIVTTQALINMLTATLLVMVPCRHETDNPCEDCIDMRMALMRNVMDNLFSAVSSTVTTPIEGVRNGRLHA